MGYGSILWGRADLDTLSSSVFSADNNTSQTSVSSDVKSSEDDSFGKSTALGVNGEYVKNIRRRGLQSHYHKPSSTFSDDDTVLSGQPEQILHLEDVDIEMAVKGYKLLDLCMSSETLNGDASLYFHIYMRALFDLIGALQTVTDKDLEVMMAKMSPEVRQQLIQLIVRQQEKDRIRNIGAPQNMMEAVIVSLIRMFFLALRAMYPYVRELVRILREEERKHHVVENTLKFTWHQSQKLQKSALGRSITESVHRYMQASMRGLAEGLAILAVPDSRDESPVTSSPL